MLKSVRYLSILFLVCVSIIKAEATHLRAGDITVRRLSCSSYRYAITLHIYTRANVPVKFSSGNSGELNYGDGSDIFHPNEVDNPPIIGQSDNGPIGEVTYTVEHTYPGPGLYTITYYEQNRNDGVLNITNSVETPFFIQTQILIDDQVGGCNNSPQLLVPPIDQGCTGVKWTHNPGAYDPDGDSLSYSLYVPKQGGVYNSDGIFVSGIDVSGYANPNSTQFYGSNGIPYSQANETGDGPPNFTIDPISGTITWNAPGKAGEYNIAFIIREWRKVPGTSTWISLGYVERDMQIVILNCQNDRPKLTVPPDLCVVAGSPPVEADIFAVDPAVTPGQRTSQDGDSTKIEAFSDVFNGVAPLATITPGPAVWQLTNTDLMQAHVHFSWQTACAHVKEQPYEIVFKATDNGAPPLASYETWKIRVVAPAPTWNTATLISGQRAATLSWNAYTCKNAVTMQVWRKVDSTPFTPPDCVTGMPDYLGYTQIATVPISSTSFIDKDLAIGAKYCYRLVAEFPDTGGESYVSQEICLPPILADAPVVTNVSVDITDTQAGQITVKWRPPFEIDKVQFPPPYSYVVMRAEGFSGQINLKPAHPGKITDTTFVDTGLNSANTVYNYRVLLFNNANTQTPIDTSATASSVRLELKPLSNRIELDWDAFVPWSNIIDADYYTHLIYRSTNTGSKAITDMTLVDSVDVRKQSFSYLDSGQIDKKPLVKTQDYCYAVMTRGSYGNPKIKAPLKNFSEITCINLTASEPPCKPVINVTGIDCNNFNTCPVLGSSYSNTIRWTKPTDPNCQKDIKSYNIYSANAIGDTFTLIGQATDTFYIHSGLRSFAQCYKVSAVNRAGIESDLSDQFCFDNCPYYELPNVFTPNGDHCNDTFSAFSIRNYGDDGWPCGASPEVKKDSLHFVSLKARCARFVLGVSLVVYNRWGKEVYKYQSGGENTIYIDWNGKDNQGRDLDGGVYYYAASVVFDVVDPKQKNRTIKGWVQLIR